MKKFLAILAITLCFAACAGTGEFFKQHTYFIGHEVLCELSDPQSRSCAESAITVAEEVHRRTGRITGVYDMRLIGDMTAARFGVPGAVSRDGFHAVPIIFPVCTKYFPANADDNDFRVILFSEHEAVVGGTLDDTFHKYERRVQPLPPSMYRELHRARLAAMKRTW